MATIDGTVGDDTITTWWNSAGGETAGNSADSISGGSGNDNLDAGDGDDTIDAGSGNDSVEAGYGNDVVHLGSGDDYVYTFTTGSDTYYGEDGADFIYADVGNQSIDGGNENDTLYGWFGNDTIAGGAGDDQLRGEGDADVFVLAPGFGNDTVQDFTHGVDKIDVSAFGVPYEAIVQTAVTGGLRLDVGGASFTLNGIAAGGIDATDFIGLFSGTATPTTGNDTLIGTPAGNTIDGLAGNDSINGFAGNDRLLGNLGLDTLAGGDGADTLDGGDADDLLRGGAGADSIVGGAGSDTVDYGDFASGALINLLSGGATVAGNYAEADTITGVENAVGTSAADTILAGLTAGTIAGGGGNDTIAGSAGGDRLDGGAGNDSMSGSLGNDTYIVDTLADVVDEAAGGGSDTIETGLTYSLALLSNVENLTLTGLAAVGGTGNAGANRLTGNTSANVLDGGGGLDTLAGGGGDDVYVVDTTTDTLTEAAGGGTDQVQSSVSFSLAALANIENLTLTGTAAINATGNGLANALIGNAADNLLDGGVGADTLAGDQGNDIYVVDSLADSVVESAGGGAADLIRSSVSFSLAALGEVENLTLTGTAASGSGNVLANLLTGDAAANSLTGGGGADTLTGGGGNDTLTGGLDGDLFVLAAGSGADVVTDFVNGQDQIDVSALGVGYASLVRTAVTGGVRVSFGTDSLTFTGVALADLDPLDFIGLIGGSIPTTGNDALGGTAGNDSIDALAGNDSVAGYGGADTLLGNGGGDSLAGGDGDDRLDGGLGNDTLAGGLGNDTFVVDSALDQTVEVAAAGTDTVLASLSWTLGATIENLTLTGAAVNGTGNALANLIIGNAAGNMLNGLEGDDTIRGGAGADTLAGAAGLDTADYADLAGGGTIDLAAGRATVAGVVDVLSGIENAAGTQGDDSVAGDGQANRLDGGSGNDTLAGGGGLDTLIGGAGSDRADYGSETEAVGIDLALQGATVGGVIETLSSIEQAGGGQGNDTITGSAEANTLLGSGGDDQVSGGAGDDRLEGGNGDDNLAGEEGNDSLYGGAGDDMLGRAGNIWTDPGNNFFDGGDGADQFLNGSGNDTQVGGAGNDEFSIYVGSGADSLDGGAGLDNLTFTGLTGISLDLPAGSIVLAGTTTILRNFENASTGAGGDTVTGTGTSNGIYTWAGNDSIDGGAGDDDLYGGYDNDTIRGGAGADTMDGFDGDDVYYVDALDDLIDEYRADWGTDTVISSLTLTLSDLAENLTLDGTAAIDGTGHAGANVLTGNAASNILDGAGGVDTLAGGGGDDAYLVDTTTDVINEIVGGGNDLVISRVSLSLAPYLNVERLQLVGAALNGTGNAGANLLTGNELGNSLAGGDGADTLTGAGGADTLTGGLAADVFVLGAGSGADVVTDFVNGLDKIDVADFAVPFSAIVRTAVTGGVRVSIGGDSLTLNGVALADLDASDFIGLGAGSVPAQDNTLTGTAGADTLDALAGNDSISGLAGNDSLVGNTGNDRLAAGDGNDTIDGGAGIDVLIGGLGNDTYIVDRSRDQTIEDPVAGGGIDLVRASVSWTLAANVENLQLTGSAFVIDGTGNGLGNLIVGNAGMNLLRGLDGNDTLRGGHGVDSLDGGAGSDAVDYSDQTWGGVIDLFEQAATIAGEADTFTSIENVIGSQGNDRIIGDAGANRLAGLAGNDTLIGGGGIDTVDYSAATTGVSAELGYASSLVGTSADDDLDADNEGDFASGGGGNDTIDGWDDRQILDGGDGSDRLDASGSNCTVLGGAGNDHLSSSGYDEYDAVPPLGCSLDGGSGDDVLESSDERADILTGGGGADQFIVGNASQWEIRKNVVTITDFQAGNGGDILDFNKIYYLEDNPFSAGELRVVQQGTDTLLQLDLDGTGTFRNFETIARLQNVTASQLTAYNFDGADPVGGFVGRAVSGTGGADDIDDGVGNDTLQGLAGDDSLLGGLGNDRLDGGEGDDQLQSEAGADTLLGGAGNDALDASRGSSAWTLTASLDGGSGNDTLTGNNHFWSDPITMTGGSGRDVFHPVGATITDFAVGAGGDVLELTYLVAGSDLAANPLIAGALRVRQDGADTVVEFNSDPAADPNAFGVVALLKNVTASQLTAANLRGWDIASGTAANQTIAGTVGNDTLADGFGNDSVSGGAGNDQIGDEVWNDVRDFGNDRIDGGDGNDTLYGYPGSDTLIGGAGDDNLVSEGADSVDGGDGNDFFYCVSGTQTVVGGAGDDAISLGTGSAASSAYTVDAGAGDDFILVDVRGASATLTGGAGRDEIALEMYDNEWPLGLATIIDFQTGPAGDQLSFESLAWQKEFQIIATDFLDAGGRARLVQIGADTQLEIDFDADDGQEVFVPVAILRNVQASQLTLANFSGPGQTGDGQGGSDEIEGVENILGSAFADQLTGNDAANSLIGAAGDDTVRGEGGDDTLDGGTGADSLAGGAGNDFYRVDAAADTTVELSGQGIDTVESGLTWTLAANLDNLTLTGSAAITGTGNSLANVLTGNAGTNTLTGLAGNDTYVVQNATDVVVEAAGGGTDLVLASLSWTLAGELENLTLTGTAAITGTGNGLANVITGNAGSNTLTGLAGNDTYVVQNATDAIVEAAGGGTDSVVSDVSWSLGAELENLTLTGTAAITGTGNELANRITGNAAANTLDGGAGLDSLAGGAGDDLYVVDTTTDVLTELASAGNDSVRSTVSFSLAAIANMENLALAGAAVTGTGNALANRLTGNAAGNVLNGLDGDDTIRGGAGVDTIAGGNGADVVDYSDLAGGGTISLATQTATIGGVTESFTGIEGAIGSSGADTITGTGAANWLDGSTGSDQLAGGAGDDTYTVDVATDKTTELAGGGADTIRSSVSLSLADTARANIENLTLTGTAALAATGSAANNQLTGNDGANTLSGGAGLDTLAGGAGDDLYAVDSTTDVLIEAAGGGFDTVQSSVTFSLAALGAMENLALTGAAVGGTGNAIANRLTGNATGNALSGLEGADTLDGGAGADTLAGGSDNDTYFVDNALDQTVEVAGGGTDTVLAGLSWTLAADVEALTLTGTSANNATGNAGANMLIGNAGANMLTGGEGPDTLTGGGGADRFVYTAVGDASAGSADEITDFVSGSDKIDLRGVAAGGVFIGAGGFVAGGTIEARFDAGTHQLQVDVSNDGVLGAGDLVIGLGSIASLAAVDLVFL